MFPFLIIKNPKPTRRRSAFQQRRRRRRMLDPFSRTPRRDAQQRQPFAFCRANSATCEISNRASGTFKVRGHSGKRFESTEPSSQKSQPEDTRRGENAFRQGQSPKQVDSRVRDFSKNCQPRPLRRFSSTDPLRYNSKTLLGLSQSFYEAARNSESRFKIASWETMAKPKTKSGHAKMRPRARLISAVGPNLPSRRCEGAPNVVKSRIMPYCQMSCLESSEAGQGESDTHDWTSTERRKNGCTAFSGESL